MSDVHYPPPPPHHQPTFAIFLKTLAVLPVRPRTTRAALSGYGLEGQQIWNAGHRTGTSWQILHGEPALGRSKDRAGQRTTRRSRFVRRTLLLHGSGSYYCRVSYVKISGCFGTLQRPFLSATIRGVRGNGSNHPRDLGSFEGFFVLARRSILSSETARRSKQVSVRSKRQLFCAAAARGSPS